MLICLDIFLKLIYSFKIINYDELNIKPLKTE